MLRRIMFANAMVESFPPHAKDRRSPTPSAGCGAFEWQPSVSAAAASRRAFCAIMCAARTDAPTAVASAVEPLQPGAAVPHG